MTLPGTSNKVTYNGDGTTTVFSVNFVFWENADLRVIHRDASAVETVWVEGTQYTLTGGNGSTGSLTVKTTPTDYTPASGTTLTIKDAQPETQGDAFPLSGAFPSTVVEQRLDKLTRLIQNHSEEIARSVLLPESTALSGLNIPEPGAGELLRYNAGGTNLETVALSDLSIATANAILGGLATNDFLTWDNAQSAWVNIAPGATGLALFQDTSAAAARTELGLGDAALKTVGVANGNLPAMDATGYPAADGSQITDLAWDNITGNELIDVQSFTASGTWTKPAKAGANSRSRLQMRGGGGSGGRFNAGSGTGGAGGQYMEVWIDTADLGATEAATVGSGGAAVATNANGNPGGNSTFGVYTANGGNGGNSSASTSATGGIGGNGATNALIIESGANGGGTTSSVPAVGGSAVYGSAGGGSTYAGSETAGGTSTFGGDGGAGSGAAGVNGTDGSVPGGGGGGSGATGASGAGADGEIIVTTFFD